MQKVKKQKAWEDAKKKYHLSEVTVQMAKKLGLNPSQLGKVVIGKNPGKSLSQTLSALYTRKDLSD
jgi:hypothetical protein